jgi:ubiquitin C-terminal hydrolase
LGPDVDYAALGQLAKSQPVITLPFEIDLRHLIPAQPDRDLAYRLSAMAKHRGIDIDHGHYIAMCRIDGRWWTFDHCEVHYTGDVMDKETTLFERTATLFYELVHPGKI